MFSWLVRPVDGAHLPFVDEGRNALSKARICGQSTVRSVLLPRQSVTLCGFLRIRRRNIGAMKPATAAMMSPVEMPEEKR